VGHAEVSDGGPGGDVAHGFQFLPGGGQGGLDRGDLAEPSCLRCPMLATNPKMLPRLDEIEEDLMARRARAEHEAWLGEVEGIDLTLTFLRQKREETKRLARIAPVSPGMPALPREHRPGNHQSALLARTPVAG
jgi:hypothetical protein